MSWIPGLVRLATGVRPVWQGCDPAETQRIYFANHSSHLDAVVLWAALPDGLRRRTRPVAALDYWGGRVRRRLAGRLRAVLVDRGGSRGAGDPLAPLQAALDEGDSLIIFPEGTRSLDGMVAPFKSGLYRLALRNPAVELVPVRLQNLNRLLPKGEILPVPLLGGAVFGAPIAPDDGESKGAFLERARRAVEELDR